MSVFSAVYKTLYTSRCRQAVVITLHTGGPVPVVSPALEPVPGDGGWQLRGVVADGVPAPLGRFYWRVGPHFLGIDDSWEQPVLARAYYDPARDTSQRAAGVARFLGYMQFVQVLFGGIPVRPDGCGGLFADRGPYVADDCTFVDFMGPADALAATGGPVLSGEQGPVLNPFYAYNGALPARPASALDFGSVPRRNGSLLFPPGTDIPNRARAASLVAAVSPGLQQPAALPGLWRMAERVHVGKEVDTRRVVADLDSSPLPGLGPVWTPRSPAAGGIEIPPPEFDEKEFAVEWRYTTYLVAQKPLLPSHVGRPLGGLAPLHGFGWSVCAKFDPDSAQLVLASVTRPRFLAEFPSVPALTRYYDQLARHAGDPAKAPAIDAGAFTAVDGPRTKGAGRRLAGLDVDGRPAIDDLGAPR
jgi:hypothetical protein